mmetsp:Transcript_19538/g.48669  ORF Transcript_19538/g.48669 Transcript_19538/m.48669 type:complete len:111 (+) Transcript_19538:141-473(+)
MRAPTNLQRTDAAWNTIETSRIDPSKPLNKPNRIAENRFCCCQAIQAIQEAAQCEASTNQEYAGVSSLQIAWEISILQPPDKPIDCINTIAWLVDDISVFLLWRKESAFV